MPSDKDDLPQPDEDVRIELIVNGSGPVETHTMSFHTLARNDMTEIARSLGYHFEKAVVPVEGPTGVQVRFRVPEDNHDETWDWMFMQPEPGHEVHHTLARAIRSLATSWRQGVPGQIAPTGVINGS